MDSIQDLKWRYAVKKFDEGKSLPKEKIDKLKEAFGLTATSYGLQPVKMVIVANKALQETLVPHSYNQKQVGQASHLLVFCIEQNIDSDFIEDYFKRVKEVRGTSDEILNPFKSNLLKSFGSKTDDEITEWATNQAYLAMGNLLTICAIEKIDACPMGGFVPKKYDEVLQLDKRNLKSVLAMPIGYRASDDMFSEMKKVRKVLEETIIEIS